MRTLSPAYGIRLTRREKQICSMVIEGLSSKLIATTLSISTFTVANHRKNILKKKGVKRIKELSL